MRNLHHKVREIVDEMLRRYNNINNVEIWLTDPIGNIADIVVDSRPLDEDIIARIFELEETYGTTVQDVLEEELKKRGINITFNI